MFHGHVAPMGRETVYRVFWLGNMKERGTSQDIGVARRIILKGNFQSMGCRPGRDLLESVQGQVECTVIILRFLQDVRNFLTAGRFDVFSRRVFLHEVSCFTRV
jgi:hypothetical protein